MNVATTNPWSDSLPCWDCWSKSRIAFVESDSSLKKALGVNQRNKKKEEPPATKTACVF